MAIDAATIDTAAAAQRPVPRARPESPIINDGHNSRGVEIKGEMSFGDFLDIINPLQHIPIVSNIYREITGDTIKPSSKVIGGILYGGPIGGMASIANAVVEEAQGKDFGDQIMASLGFGGGDHTAPDANTAVAAKPDGAKPDETNPATATAAGAAQVAPAQVAAAADKPVRLTASGTPPAGAALGLGAQAGAQAAAAQTAAAGTGRDALAAAGAPHPTRMPPRDTPLANSMMARHAAPKILAPTHGTTLVNGQAAASGHTGSSTGSAASAGQGGSTGSAGAGSAAAGSAAKATGGLMLEAQDGAAPNVMTPVSPDMLSETMMRNLAKYEQSRKAAQSAAPSLRVSG